MRPFLLYEILVIFFCVVIVTINGPFYDFWEREMKKIILSVALASMLAAPMALTQDNKKVHPTVKYRHHSMETIKDSLIAMKMILGGKGDSAEFSIHARVMAANAEGFYAAAKQKIAGGDSKQAVWDNWDDFAVRMETYIKDANTMAGLPANADAGAKKMAFGKTVKNCKSCHDKYRAE